MNKLMLIEWNQLVNFFDKNFSYLFLLMILFVCVLIVVVIIKKIRNLVVLAKQGRKKEFFGKIIKYAFMIGLIVLGIYLSKIILGIVIFIVLFPILGEMMNVKYHDNYYENNR